MKTLMILAVGAAISTLALVNSAHAAPACATRQAAIYFEKGRADVTAPSKAIVERLAAEAKACEHAQVVADAPRGQLESDRADAIRSAFAEAGVKVTLASGSPLAPIPPANRESILERAAVVRLEAAAPVG